MISNNHVNFERQVYFHLNRVLTEKDWTLKREYRHDRYCYDIALFHRDTLYTFIEIKHCQNKSSFNRMKNSAELQIRKSFNNLFNYGILFLNGKLFLVGEKSSKHIKSFPLPGDYIFRKDITLVLYNKADGFDIDDYDEESIEVYKYLLEAAKFKSKELESKNKELESKNKALVKENKNLKAQLGKLTKQIEHIRNSMAQNEVKIKLVDSYFLDYITLHPDLGSYKKYNIDWCENWNKLDSESQKFIKESENLYEHILEDYTPFVHGFAKALENEILLKLFNEFLKYSEKNEINLNYKITDKINKGTITVFRTFLKRGDLDSFLSLDKMRFIVSAIFSETDDELLLTFRPVYLKYFNQMKSVFSKHGEINKLKMIRNRGAHTKTIEKEIANNFYLTFKSTFNKIINNYKL